MPYSRKSITVYCPVCGVTLGNKKKGELASFICSTEGCSQTKHYFYPNEVKRPGKSIPWASYHEKKQKCNCPACQARDSAD